MDLPGEFQSDPRCVVLEQGSPQVETCTGAGAVNSRGFPAGAGEKIFQVPQEGREREILLAGTRGSGFDCAGISARKNCEVISLVFLGK
jgi:hypothetical protein